MKLIDVIRKLEVNNREQTRLLEEQIALLKKMIEILEKKEVRNGVVEENGAEK